MNEVLKTSLFTIRLKKWVWEMNCQKIIAGGKNCLLCQAQFIAYIALVQDTQSTLHSECVRVCVYTFMCVCVWLGGGGGIWHLIYYQCAPGWCMVAGMRQNAQHTLAIAVERWGIHYYHQLSLHQFTIDIINTLTLHNAEIDIRTHTHTHTQTHRHTHTVTVNTSLKE